ncbi:hypothetical protein DL770_002012 [Monosporascus sp. CRB-9-2]|nr:hypothetical protein DL770_002012 [Monosporascus sp. CRB-9-2]
MAANIPAKLRQAGITPFVLRASQLDTARPIISYWCRYWAVNQILGKQLHNADQECLEFTTALMDRLEQTKNEQAGNEAILDDVAGQAYVEQFAQETFERAMRPLKANKVNQQTASTFEAASTFFQLLNIWGQPDAETQQKIKYAKWNAARILKAIKEGKDPNESNPKQEEKREEDAGMDALDPDDPEVQMIVGSGQPKPASVEDAPDEDDKLRVAPVSAPTSPSPPTDPGPQQVSPIAPTEQQVTGTESYFPDAAPKSHTDQDPFTLPSAPSMPAGGIPSPSPHDPTAPSPLIPSPSSHEPGMPPFPISPPDAASTPQDFYRHAPPPPVSAPAPSAPIVPPQAPPAASSHYSHLSRSSVPPAASQATQQTTYGATNAPTGYNTDDMAVVQAQKHAKWAISALNFEDVPTAVRELQNALAVLGAR